MASAFGNLSGSGPQQVWVYLSYVSYSQAGNYSTWDWELRYYGNGYGSWTNGTQYWSLSGFAVGSGTFTIPSGEAYDTYKVLGKGRFNKAHDANGNLAAGTLTGSISTNHDRIGSGSASVSTGTPPRIPKVPATMPAPSLGNAGVSSFDVTFSGPNNNGSALVRYEIQVATNSSFTGAETFSTVRSPWPITGRTPGVKYWVRIRALNGVGWGSWSAASTVSTLTALYFLDPNNPDAPPEPLVLYAWNGSTYELVNLLIDPELDGTFVPAG